ncbi:MAG TPA: tRNA lysidine(34) synthetase TilS [Polyangia bacterium]|jgi:tRNA(Ile)-lysidine synthase|nr:tRNA lysidine(34) synthetase TilS [Polyangia bacterium]
MLSTIHRTIRAHALVSDGDVVIVAVSGGPDSMALLHALWELAARLRVRLEVATVDHGLRPEARAECELVRARAQALELPWHGLPVDVAAARRERASWQDAARRVRLEALTALAARRGAARVALAHQADDQAETVLFRVVRGTGLAGLAGIPYLRAPFIRPLLDVTRAEIARYVKRRSLPFVEDPSNADLRYARARVRHRWLPLLAEENPRVREALVALAAAAREARAEGAPLVSDDDARGELPPDVGRRAAEVVARLRGSGGTRRIDVSGRRIVEVAYGRVQILARQPSARAACAALSVPGPGTYALAPEATSLCLRCGALGHEDASGAFDAEALAWPLVLRARRSGDRMRPRGGRGSRKLADLLIDAKVPREARDTLPVLTTADDVVLFVPGLRPAEEGRPTAQTARFLRVAPLDPKET